MKRISRRCFVHHSAVGLGMAAIGWPALAKGEALGRATPAAFFEAVVVGDAATVRRLLTADPSLIAARDELGRSAFLLANLHRHMNVAGDLRERGYQLDLHELAFVGEWEMFDDRADDTEGAVNAMHPVGGTAMYAAALGGAGSDIWHVYRHGADPNLRPRAPTAMSPVRAAFEHPDLGVAEMTAASMLSNDARADATEPDGVTALHAATARGSALLAEMLIRKGASVNARDAAGRTPLGVAEEKKHSELVDLLRHHQRIPRDCQTGRAAYDVEGNPYRTPNIGKLPAADRRAVVGMAHGNFDGVRERVGAEPRLAHARATTNERAVEAGGHMGNKPIVDYLLDHGAPYALTTAVMRGDTATVRRRLAEDPLGIHERGAHDFALLWYPIIGGGNVEMASLLLDAGAEPERQHFLGTTALHWAAMGGLLEMAELLITRGADVNRPGRKFGAEPQTPLDIARVRDRTEMVQLLRSHGAR